MFATKESERIVIFEESCPLHVTLGVAKLHMRRAGVRQPGS